MRIPEAPETYDPVWMTRVVQQLAIVLQEIRRKDVTLSRVRITDLPTSSTGLFPGELWNDTGTVKVKL